VKIINLLQVTGGSVFLLGRQWNIYLHTRELCEIVLSTTILGVVKCHSHSTTRQNEIFQALVRLSLSLRLWKEMEGTKNLPSEKVTLLRFIQRLERYFTHTMRNWIAFESAWMRWSIQSCLKS